MNASRPSTLKGAAARVTEKTNYELIQTNQRLTQRLSRLTIAYQALERGSFGMREKHSQLLMRMEELKDHLRDIKSDVGGRVGPIRLIAEHLAGVACFLEGLDQSILDEDFIDSHDHVNVEENQCLNQDLTVSRLSIGLPPIPEEP